MGRKHRKPEEIIRLLKQSDVLLSQGKSVSEVCREIGVSDATYYKWRKEYGGMGMDQVRRLKELELENKRLRRAVSDLTLDNQILKDVSEGNLQALSVVATLLFVHSRNMAYQNAGRVRLSVWRGRFSVIKRQRVRMRKNCAVILPGLPCNTGAMAISGLQRFCALKAGRSITNV